MRDPNERIAKSGQGFSRILSAKKPEFLSQQHFYPHESVNADYKVLGNEKIHIKKKKKRSRPMSAHRI